MEAAPAAEWPSLPRAEVEPLLISDHGLPQIDWEKAAAWLTAREPGKDQLDGFRRAIVSGWLDALCAATKVESHRWHRGPIEGLAPVEGAAAARLERCAEHALTVIHEAMVKIRGEGPIPPIALIGLGDKEEYYSFVAHFMREDGHFGTSGGMYIRRPPPATPLLVIDAQVKWGLEATVAHELTHHALAGRKLPLWAEEGLTQMMEERVTCICQFTITQEQLREHRDLWLTKGFAPLMDGKGFRSPTDNVQTLTYHLAQMMVRSLLSTHPKEFFAFARDCAEIGPEAAAARHLPAPPERIAEALLRA
jgi:hypothetical protein